MIFNFLVLESHQILKYSDFGGTSLFRIYRTKQISITTHMSWVIYYYTPVLT